MTIDTDSWHRSDGSTPDGSRVNNLDAAEQIDPDLSREYAAPELGRIKEVLSSIDHKALNDLETRMKEKMEDEKLDQETVHYLSDFLGALQMLQAEKSGRNLENMIDKEASNDRRLDRILSIQPILSI